MLLNRTRTASTWDERGPICVLFGNSCRSWVKFSTSNPCESYCLLYSPERLSRPVRWMSARQSSYPILSSLPDSAYIFIYSPRDRTLDRRDGPAKVTNVLCEPGTTCEDTNAERRTEICGTKFEIMRHKVVDRVHFPELKMFCRVTLVHIFESWFHDAVDWRRCNWKRFVRG